MLRYFITYKPYEVLSQFTSQEDKKTLKDYFNVAQDIYPVGRLDYDSEGLLLLTNDKNINHRLLHPEFSHEREYWVQVDGNPTQQALQQIQNGVVITVDGKKYQTLTITFETGIWYQVDQGPFVVEPKLSGLVFRQLMLDNQQVTIVNLQLTPYIL